MDCKINDTKNMNKLFATFVLLISIVCLSQAQDGYIKYLTDSEYRNKTVKVFKGDIIPFINTSKAMKINIIIGGDTITDVASISKSFEVFESANTTYNSQKADFLQLKKGGVVWVNATSILNTDTVTLISERGQRLTQLIDIREAQVNQSEIGKTCRLIISNSPSLFYSTDKLKQFVEPEPIQEPENTETQTEENKDPVWALWQIILFSVLGLGIIVFCGWWFIKKRNSEAETEQEPIYVTYYNNKSLSNFAIDNHIDLDTLLQYNKGVVDKKYSRYNDIDRKKVQSELKNKKLIVGFQEKGFATSNNNFTKTETTNKPIAKAWESPNETFVQPTDFANNNELSSQLRQMESNLIREIQLGRSGNNNQNEINKLRNEKTEVENKLNLLETEKRNVDAKLMQMQTDKISAENNFQTATAETLRVQNEMKELKERVIAVEFLKGYSESVFSYLKYCQQVSSDAFNFFNKISQQNPKHTFSAGHLLMNFQSAVNSIPVGDWLRTLQDIIDSGATTNRQLTRSFSQIQNESDKQKEFQRLLFSEVLTKYSSNILILAEAFKNISRFQGSADFASDAQSIFGKHVTEIINKAKATGLDIKHVPLFESWEKYVGQVEDNGGERSLAYKEINGLEKGAIAEIVSYGVITTIGDDTKTIIILA
jgi:hypothetical protein